MKSVKIPEAVKRRRAGENTMAKRKGKKEGQARIQWPKEKGKRKGRREYNGQKKREKGRAGENTMAKRKGKKG
jgi:hypothetical protein